MWSHTPFPDGGACDPDVYPRIITDPSGNITSPDYPSGYPNYMDCYWLFLAPEGQVVKHVILCPSNASCEVSKQRFVFHTYPITSSYIIVAKLLKLRITLLNMAPILMVVGLSGPNLVAFWYPNQINGKL